MDRAGDQFLAGSALTRNHDGRLRRRHLPDQRKYLLHAGRRPDQIHQNALVRELPLQALRFFGQPALGRGTLQQQPQRARLNRLFQKPKSAEVVHGLDGRFDVAESREHDRGRTATLVAHAFQKLEPVHPRHHKVRNEDMERTAG